MSTGSHRSDLHMPMHMMVLVLVLVHCMPFVAGQ